MEKDAWEGVFLGKHVVFCEPEDTATCVRINLGPPWEQNLVWFPGSNLMFSVQPHFLSACSLLVAVLAGAEHPCFLPSGLLGWA